MKLSDRSIKIEYQDIIAFLITILLTSFPIFGQYGMTIQKYGLWILGILGFLITILKGWISFNRILVGYAFYFLFSIISILWCVDLSSAYIRIMDMFKVLLIGCFIVSYCKKESNIQKFLSFYVFGTAFISIYCFIQDVSTFSSWSRLGKIAFEKAGQNQIYYSCILIYSVIIILYRMFESKNNKVFYMILFAFLYGCGLLTAVRKCLVIPVRAISELQSFMFRLNIKSMHYN